MNFKLGVLHEMLSLATWNFGTILVFGFKEKKTLKIFFVIGTLD